MRIHWFATFVVGIIVGILIHWIYSRRKRNNHSNVKSSQTQSVDRETKDKERLDVSEDGEYKVVIVVNTDIKMGKGKVVAQCAHGALSCSEKVVVSNANAFHAWKACAQPIIVVKAKSEQELLTLMTTAEENNLICSIIFENAEKEAANTNRTILAIGPGKADVMNKVTGHLKLY